VKEPSYAGGRNPRRSLSTPLKGIGSLRKMHRNTTLKRRNIIRFTVKGK